MSRPVIVMSDLSTRRAPRDRRPVTHVATSAASRPALDGSADPAVISILNADATAEEVAAVVVALAALAARAAPVPAAARRTSNWAAPARRLRAPHRPGHDQWRANPHT